MLGDLSAPFLISGLKEDHKIAEGDFIRLECGAIVYNYTNEVVWRKDGGIIESSEHVTVEEANTKYSWRKALTWKQISSNDNNGVYECEAVSKDPLVGHQSHTIAISVHDTQAPIITANFNQSRMQQSLGDSLKLDCLVSGLPVPNLIWYKNDAVFSVEEISLGDSTMQRVMMEQDNTSIVFTVLKLEDEGTYKCVAWNRVGQDFRSIELEIPSESPLPYENNIRYQFFFLHSTCCSFE